MKEKKPINIEIGQHVKMEREAAGLTQEEFAELVGLGVKHISAIECGAVGLSLATLQKVCRVLAISSDALLFGERKANDTRDLVQRLERLSPAQYRIANDVMCRLLEAFALADDVEK